MSCSPANSTACWNSLCSETPSGLSAHRIAHIASNRWMSCVSMRVVRSRIGRECHEGYGNWQGSLCGCDGSRTLIRGGRQPAQPGSQNGNIYGVFNGASTLKMWLSPFGSAGFRLLPLLWQSKQFRPVLKCGSP